jgi:multidrug efflux pump subunit AcrB
VGTPRVYADVDRRKADLLGVPPERMFEALQVYLGSAFVNDFNLLGRTYRVTAQADPDHRSTVADIANLKTRSRTPARWCRSARANSETRPAPTAWCATTCNRRSKSMATPRRLFDRPVADHHREARRALPAGYGGEWTDIAYEQPMPATPPRWSSAWPCSSSSCAGRAVKA